MTDLTVLSDAILDDALERLFGDLRAAKDDGDHEEAKALHQSVTEILAEQSRRLDAWLARQVG